MSTIVCTLDSHGACSCDGCREARLAFLSDMVERGSHVAVTVPAEGLRPERTMVVTAEMARVYVENGATLARLSDGLV
jgi:hypothetical protein